MAGFALNWWYVLGKRSFTQRCSLMGFSPHVAAEGRECRKRQDGFAHGLSLTLPRKSHIQGTALHLEMIL